MDVLNTILQSIRSTFLLLLLSRFISVSVSSSLFPVIFANALTVKKERRKMIQET